MKKIFILIFVLSISLLLVGCDKNTSTFTNATKNVTTTTAPKTNEITTTKTNPTTIPDTTTKTTKTHALSRELNDVSLEYDKDIRNKSANIIRNIDGMLDHLEAFSAKLSEYAKEDFYESGNDLLLSPLSIYLAFVMQYECLNSVDKASLRTFLGVSEDEITQTKTLIDSLVIEGDGVALDIFNSIWLNSGLEMEYDDTILDNLGKNYYTNVIEANFKEENQQANQILRNYVKEKTRGLIDNDFGISEAVLYLLVNALYVEDMWDDEEFKQRKEDFTYEDSTIKNTDFNISKYHDGQVGKEEKYSFQRIISLNNFTLSFILPNDGYTIEEVFTEDTIKNVNGYKYVYSNSSLMENYHTRCIFPSFDIGSNVNIGKTIEKYYDVDFLFNSFDNRLVDCDTVIDKVIHQTRLKVNKDGFKGAAVTIITTEGASAGIMYREVYYDFLVNKPFGVILSNNNGVIIFTGIVNNIQ